MVPSDERWPALREALDAARPATGRPLAQLHIRRSRASVRDRLFARLRGAGRPDVAEVLVDGTVVRAHQKAADAREEGDLARWLPDQGARVACDALGWPRCPVVQGCLFGRG